MAAKFLVGLMLVLGATASFAGDILRVGLSANYPPLGYSLEGRIVGIEADNAMAVGEIIGRRMQLVDMPLEKLIPALLAGEIDVIMSGLGVTPERSAQLSFTDAYMQAGQMAIMHRDKLASFSQPWAVYRPGVRIGVQRGTAGEAFAKTELKDARLQLYNDSGEGFAALRADQIDLLISDAPTSWQLATAKDNNDLLSLYVPLTEESLAWAVRPDETALLRELNRALALMKSNGTLKYILNRWVPVQIEVR